ncbi:unnamed protein product [Rotaria magnacalcarata]|uniref:Uncharacterized protein n=1 Tax=Rotaria magnacalcarata TaxID=392030 RepID=A0A816YVK7_9BILA|nr:unnamed protein product [Rotaria magnacalcarata]
MASIRKQFAIVDHNTCVLGLTSSSITCSKDQSLEHYPPITFEKYTYGIEIDKNNENVVPKCLDITEKLTSNVEQLYSNNPIALDRTMKKDVMKMKHESVYNEEGRKMPEKFAAPVGYTLKKINTQFYLHLIIKN